jgi:phosphoglycerate dehydrogenase-like enzyme
MRRPRIAIVNSSSFGRIYPDHLRRLARVGEVRRFTVPSGLKGTGLAGRLKGFHAVIASVNPAYDDAYFRLSPDLVLITRHGIGYNNVDTVAATTAGVLVSRVPGVVEREAMAEHTVGLILAVARRFRPADRAVRVGRWETRPRFVGFELKARTIGVVGCGNIGSRVATILARGFGARVIACDPNVPSGIIKKLGARKVPLSVLLREADVISLHASLDEKSRGMIGNKELNKMRRGAVVVNTARGELTDERVLGRALQSGRLAGLGLDVVAREPAGRGHPLLRHENVIMVPHIGAYTVESLRGMGDKVVDDVERVLGRGKPPREVVNPLVLKSRALRMGVRRWD